MQGLLQNPDLNLLEYPWIKLYCSILKKKIKSYKIDKLDNMGKIVQSIPNIYQTVIQEERYWTK